MSWCAPSCRAGAYSIRFVGCRRPIPAVLSGLGLLWSVSRHAGLFRPFYGTIVLLVVAQVLGGITLGNADPQSQLRAVGQGASKRVVAHVGAVSGAPICVSSFADGADHGDGGGYQVHVRGAA